MFQLRTLKRTFDQFDSEKSGSISVETLNTILKMMGMHVSSRALDVSVVNSNSTAKFTSLHFQNPQTQICPKLQKSKVFVVNFLPVYFPAHEQEDKFVQFLFRAKYYCATPQNLSQCGE